VAIQSIIRNEAHFKYLVSSCHTVKYFKVIAEIPHILT